jgi:hypothetical protein
MINSIIVEMVKVIDSLQNDIVEDIEDVREANHENLLDRNDIKLEKMEQIVSFKEELNSALVKAVQDGEDVDKYREAVGNLEEHLFALSKLNSKLASIVLPVKEMYKEIIDEIVSLNGGHLLEIRA